MPLLFKQDLARYGIDSSPRLRYMWISHPFNQFYKARLNSFSKMTLQACRLRVT